MSTTERAPAAATEPDVTRQIRDAILEAEFAPHQRLIEADLSDRFGASRGAVRSALMNLANEGLIERLPNRGARVRAITVEEAVEIVEVRIGLESLCARKATERLTNGDAESLRELRERIIHTAAVGDLVQYSRTNQEMDRRIRELSGHETARLLLERLRAQSARHQFRLSFLPGRAQVSAGEHAAILDAVLAGDAAGAEAATKAHLEGVIQLLRSQD